MLRLELVVLAILTSIVPAYAAGKTPVDPTFKGNCVFCHGEDGTGKTPPGMALGAHDLSSREIQKKTDAELARTITQGQNKMPSFANKLDETQIRDVIRYIRTLGKKN